MAANVFGGPLNAGRVLRASSSQEALNFDEQVQSVEPAQISRGVPALGLNQKNHLYRWWQRHVCLSTPRDDCRDHFANERTALAYMRTAQVWAMLGVVIAQLMRLQRSSNPDPHLGFFVVSVPLSCVCHLMALLTSILGCYRFFKWQTSMSHGQATSGGWVIMFLFTLTCLILVCMFVLVTIISVRRDR